ncbi:MAG: hypothetical protein NTY15_04625 [Planctomycetota bacterium]|nr:hypothetical protein [Planctomycetota bacterium]
MDPPVQTKRSILVVVGAAGEEEFGKIFRESAERWRVALQADELQLLDGTDVGKSDGKDHRQQILDWCSRVDNEPNEGGILGERWLVMIGHGTHDRNSSKFNLKGPDITAEAIAKAMSAVKVKWLVIDGSSSSGPFINALSGENRIIITATKSGSEQNYSRFSEYMSKSISDPSTDLDHDDCVSILEAFLAASNRVSQFYENEGRLASEQALLDDNGDRRGTPAAFYRGARPAKAPANGLKLDGALASRTLVFNFGQPDLRTAEDKAQSELLLDQIESLRDQKKELGQDAYFEKIERLFLELAKVMPTK